MRTLWILFSALVAALVIALCVASPVDPLHLAAAFVVGPAMQGVPAGEPVTRFADAALIGAVAAYLLIFIPLSAATWIDGGRRAGAIAAALKAPPSDAPSAPSSLDSATPWWPLLSPYATAVERDSAPTTAGSAAAPAAKSGRSAVIDGIVAYQSGAAVFADFPVVAIGLGFIALMGQLLPVLAADPAALIGAGSTVPDSAIGIALARGFCSLAAATAAAALFGLVSRLVAAILRQRAESICGALDQAGRVWGDIAATEPAALTMTPLPQPARDRGEGVDDALVEHVAARIWQLPGAPGREVAESVDSAIRDIHATTLRPMLHDISRLMSLLGDRATHLVTTVDERLGQQAEHTRQILAATQEITRALAALAARGDAGAEGAGRGELMAVDGLRQALSDERDAAATLLRSIGQDLTGQLDTALRTATRSIVRPLSVQSETVRKVIERIDAAAEAMARAGSVVEQSTGALGQKLDLLAASPAGPKDGGGSAGVAEDIAAIARASREALESLAALSDQLKQAPRPPASPSEGMTPAREAHGRHLDSGSWAQRVSALHRASIDLTSDLPALEIRAPRDNKSALETEGGS